MTETPAYRRWRMAVLTAVGQPLLTVGFVVVLVAEARDWVHVVLPAAGPVLLAVPLLRGLPRLLRERPAKFPADG